MDKSDFIWSELGENMGGGHIIALFTSECKVNFSGDPRSMYDVFCEIFPSKIFELMVRITNRKAEQKICSLTLNPNSRYKQWFQTTVIKYLLFILNYEMR